MNYKNMLFLSIKNKIKHNKAKPTVLMNEDLDYKS